MNLLAFADPGAAEAVDTVAGPATTVAEQATNVAEKAAETVTTTVGTSWDAVTNSFTEAWHQTIGIAFDADHPVHHALDREILRALVLANRVDDERPFADVGPDHRDRSIPSFTTRVGIGDGDIDPKRP